MTRGRRRLHAVSSRPSGRCLFGFADLPLRFAFQIFRLALELLAGVAGQAADRVANLAFRLLAKALGLVLEAVAC